MPLDATDYTYLAQTLRLAERGRYTTQPNPRVGCVIVRAGQVIAEGWHQYAGGPHAERVALATAGIQARGATAYVSLEPCRHHGRTPPCTAALIAAGITRVVAATLDPNPQVAGQGFNALRQAGIQVDYGGLAAAAQALNPGFIKRMRQGLPWVRVKSAMSVDGRTALANGVSQWITGADARCDVQRLRAQSGAIITGIGTVLADDPALTVRLTPAELPGVTCQDMLLQPLRVVLDTQLRLPPPARLLHSPGTALILCGLVESSRIAHLVAQGAHIHVLPTVNGRIDLTAVLRYLATLEINEVLVEAGATLTGAFLQAGLVDEWIIYMAPHLLGNSARGLCHLPELREMQQRLELKIQDVRAIGNDWRLTLQPRYEQCSLNTPRT